MTKNVYLKPNELTPEIITNLYLYGSVEVPSSKAHNGEDVIIKMDMSEYMKEGFGSYAHISDSKIVQEFFRNINDIPEGSYNISDLKKMGYSDAENIFSFAHYNIDTKSADYAQRVYIYNNVSFKLSDNTVFVVKDGQGFVQNTAILAFHDNFDFKSKGLAQIGNNLILKPAIDPEGIGKEVKIEYENKDEVPVIEKYDISDFIADVKESAGKATGTIYDAYKAMNIVIKDLSSNNIISTPVEPYIVQKGDTIYQLAQDLKMSVDDLKQLNPWLLERTSEDGTAILIKAQTDNFDGDKIKVPADKIDLLKAKYENVSEDGDLTPDSQGDIVQKTAEKSLLEAQNNGNGKTKEQNTKDWFETVSDTLTGWVESTADFVSDAALSIVDEVTGGFNDAISKVGGWFSGFISQANAVEIDPNAQVNNNLLNLTINTDQNQDFRPSSDPTQVGNAIDGGDYFIESDIDVLNGDGVQK